MTLLAPDMYWVKKCHPKKSEPKTHPAPSKTISTPISDARRWGLPASYARTNTSWRREPRRRAQSQMCFGAW